MVAMANGFPVVVVGAGQAGLAVSYELTARGIEHVVLERAQVGQSWLGLWDSFRLVTPNWTMSLPGATYTGDDPEGLVPRDEVVRYLQQYASSFGAPIREGVSVDSLEPGRNGGFLLRTSAGELRTAAVVVCTGAYQRPHRPEVAAGLPNDVLVIDAQGLPQPGSPSAREGPGRWQRPGRLPALRGAARGGPRSVPGLRTGAVAAAAARRPRPALPHLAGNGGAPPGPPGRGGRAWVSFAADLAGSVAFGDARYADIRKLLTEQLPTKGIAAPDLPDPPPFHADPPLALDLNGFGVAIFTSGFRPDYARWVRFPAFDTTGFPLTDNGASTVVPGLFFCGVHFLRKRKSAVLFGVGEDAAIVAQSVARHHRTTEHPNTVRRS